MSLAELIENNQSAFLALLSALSVVVITQAASLASKWLDHRNAIKTRRLDHIIDLERKYVIEPVVKFIDSDLRLMQKIYGLQFVTKEDREAVTLDASHVAELATIQARIDGLTDDRLSRKFQEFSRARVGLGLAGPDRGGIDPYKELQGAIQLAGEILALLFSRLREIEN